MHEAQVILLSTGRLERLLLTAIVSLVGLGMLSLSLDGLAFDNFWLDESRSSLVRLFSLDQEANVPTWFASATLLLAGALALCLGRAAGPRERRRWTLVGVLLLMMSLDEAAVMHEMMIKPLRRLFDTPDILHYPWVVPAGIVAVAVALYLLPFVWRLPPPVRWRIILGGALFVSGALLVEAVSGWIEEVRGRDRLYHMTVVLEESLEFLGVFLVVSAFLRQLALLPSGVAFRVTR